MKNIKIKPKTGMATKKQLVILITICKKLNINYQDYRKILIYFYGVDTINYMTAKQANELILYLHSKTKKTRKNSLKTIINRIANVFCNMNRGFVNESAR